MPQCGYVWLLYPFSFNKSLDMFFIAVQCLFLPFTIINKLTCLLHFLLSSNLRSVHILSFLLNKTFTEMSKQLLSDLLLDCQWKLKPIPVILVFEFKIIVFVVWLINERCLTLFPVGTIVSDLHHCKSLTRREQDLNWRRT